MIDLVYYDSESMMDALIEKFEEGTMDPETGEKISVTDADYDADIRAILSAINYMGECIFNQINTEANNNLVAFCDETNLIYKGMERNTYRLPADYAQTTLEFTVSENAPEAVTVPKGTKATADGTILFATAEEVTINPGETGEALALSTEPTKDANGYTPGSINIMVNSVPYVTAVTNTTVSSDGSDVEDLEAFRKRVLYAPLTFSDVGTAPAYRQKAMEVSAAIADVVVTHDDNLIYIHLLCQDGALPSADLIALCQEYLTKEEIKAETDLITCYAAEQVEYSLEMTYKISQRDTEKATAIQEAVEKAIDDYITEIKSKMGISVNPEMFRKVAYEAGAASVTVTSPEYISFEPYQVAKCTGKSITYQGLLE